jgi:hypothetical protein
MKIFRGCKTKFCKHQKSLIFESCQKLSVFDATNTSCLSATNFFKPQKSLIFAGFQILINILKKRDVAIKKELANFNNYNPLIQSVIYPILGIIRG